jgi:hypothetical protein
VLGGSLHLAPNGYLATIQTTGIVFPSPMMVADLWPTVASRRYPKAWDGIEPEGALVIYWTPRATRIECACGTRLGKFRAYRARGEYGVVRDTPRRYQPPYRYAAEAIKHMPNDRIAPPRPNFWLTGDQGSRASRTMAHFRCSHCDREHERNLRRLGKELFESPCERFVLRRD